MSPTEGSLRAALRAGALLAPLLLLVACAGPPTIEVGSPARAREHPKWTEDTGIAWRAMVASLPGRWTATTPQNRTITVTYRAISNGSALVETFTSQSGKETISVYHPDGRELMVTHYCAQGNQARLKAVEATSTKIVFDYLDATNLAGDQDVMHRLSIVLLPDGFEKQEGYKTKSGEMETSTLHFVRDSGT